MKSFADCLADERGGRTEIVAVMVDNQGKTIMNGVQAAVAIKQGLPIVEFIPRAKVTMMAACDLGSNWRALAESPTLFVIEGGKICDGDIMKFKKKRMKR